MNEEQKKEFVEFFRALKFFALACVLFLLALIALLIGLGGFLYGLGATFFASVLEGVSYMTGSGLLVIFGVCLGMGGFFVWTIGDQGGERG